MIETLLQSTNNTDFEQFLLDVSLNSKSLAKSVDWLFLLKIASVFFIVTLLVDALLVVNDRVFEKSLEQRIRRHHLKITNNGNTPSVFLLRTINLPEYLAIRFRINGNPMIWVSRKEKVKTDEEKEEESASAEAAAEKKTGQVSEAPTKDSGLIPNLNDPMNTLETGKQVVNDVGKKAGLLGSILGTISSLLPKKVPGLSEAQTSLKGVQQSSNQIIGEVNTKVGNTEVLKGQVGSLVPADMKQDFQVGDSGKSGTTGQEAEVQMPNVIPGGPDVAESLASRNFVYDEEVWHNNIGKKDEEGGSLNYAQSKILEPGETMDIDLEILYLSDHAMPASSLYQIEVLQIPQSNLHLAAPSQTLNGVVIFPKIKFADRLRPTVTVFFLILLGIQVVAGYSFLIF